MKLDYVTECQLIAAVPWSGQRPDRLVYAVYVWCNKRLMRGLHDGPESSRRLPERHCELGTRQGAAMRGSV